MPQVDAIWLVLVVVLFLAANKGLDIYRERQRLAIEAAKPAPALCGCEHHLAHHDKRTGRCMARVRMAVSWIRNPELDQWIADESYRDFRKRPKSDQVPDRWELVGCTCQRYVGPESLGADLFSPEITTDYVETHEIDPVDGPRTGGGR